MRSVARRTARTVALAAALPNSGHREACFAWGSSRASRKGRSRTVADLLITGRESSQSSSIARKRRDLKKLGGATRGRRARVPILGTRHKVDYDKLRAAERAGRRTLDEHLEDEQRFIAVDVQGMSPGGRGPLGIRRIAPS